MLKPRSSWSWVVLFFAASSLVFWSGVGYYLLMWRQD